LRHNVPFLSVNHAAYRLAVVDQSADDTKSAIETGFVSMADLSLICLPSKNRPKTMRYLMTPSFMRLIKVLAASLQFDRHTI
jgi:hypothetical protein